MGPAAMTPGEGRPVEAYTVGVEEEYQLVDPATGGLVSRARDVLEMDWAGEGAHEVQETQVEIATRICATASEVDAELRRLRFLMASVAAARDLFPVAAGLHPFSRWHEQRHTDAARYRRLIERYGRVIESEHVFGMHVHVAVPDAVNRMAVIRRMRRYLPHLIALSASSPFFEGSDTGYVSYRTILNDRLPCAGPPPPFEAERDYWAFTADLVDRGVAMDEGTSYWTVRPHHRYPTIEVRCPDVCTRVEDAVAIATLARGLVVAAGEGGLPDPADTGHPSEEALLRADQWQASRFGLTARVGCADGTLQPLPDAVRRLRDRLAPFIEGAGDGDHLDAIDTILDRGNAARRMRSVAAATGDLTELVGWLAGETLVGTGLDHQRSEPAEVC